MPRSSHANSRTYGSKLIGPRSDEATTEFPVTTRMCDIDHLNRTGEVRYIDEEEKGMPTIDQKANTKKLRADITTIEQFDAIGNYAAVAKKYHVATMTAHGLMKSLRSKKEKEEKQMINNAAKTSDTKVEETADILPREELATSDESKGIVAVDCPKEDKEEVCGENVGEHDAVEDALTKKNESTQILEVGKTSADVPSELQDEAVDTLLGKMSTKTGRYICVGCGEGVLDAVGVYAQSSLCQSCSEALAAEEKDCEPGVEDKISAEEFDQIMSKVEFQWQAAPVTKAQTIEELWIRLETTACALHKMTIEQAERDFQKRLSEVIEGC